MMLSFINISFYGRSLFFSSDISELILGNLNLEMHSPFKFHYVLNNRWFLNKKFSPYIRKFDRNNFHYYFYINNIAFLAGFGLNFVYQRFSLFFRDNFFFKTNWWEFFYFSFLFFSDFFDWFFLLRKRKRATKASKFIFSIFSSKRFFLWDPLEDDFFHYKTKNNKRHFLDENISIIPKNIFILKKKWSYKLGRSFLF
jgi:hypothetical protein